MEEIRDTIDKFKFNFETKSYYVDRTTETLLILNIPLKGDVIRVYFKRKRPAPSRVVMDIFSMFHDKIAVKEDTFGLVVSFSTLVPAVECYKKMKNHYFFPSVSLSQMLSKRQIEVLLNRLDLCGKTLEPAILTHKKYLDELAFLSKKEKEMEKLFLHYEINTQKVSKQDNAKQIINNKNDNNNINHFKPVPLDLKSVPFVNEQRYTPSHKRFKRPYEPTVDPIIPKYATPQVFIKHDREWLTPYVLYHLSILIFDETKLKKFIRKIKMPEKTRKPVRLENSDSLLQYKETQLHEVLISSEMCCEELAAYIVKHFPNIYQIHHHIRHGIYYTARYILAYVKSSEEASHLVDALKQKRFMTHKIYALSISQIEKTLSQIHL